MRAETWMDSSRWDVQPCTPLVIPRADGSHLVPFRLPVVAPDLPPTSVVPPHGSSSSSDALASKATLVTRGSQACARESFSWLWQHQLLLFPLLDPGFELGQVSLEQQLLHSSPSSFSLQTVPETLLLSKSKA